MVTMFPHAETSVPPAPRTLEETGLAFLSLVELLSKIPVPARTAAPGRALGAHQAPREHPRKLLGFGMRAERLCEVVRRGGTDGDVDYQLTRGPQARDRLPSQKPVRRRCPVSLDAYTQVVAQQSVGVMRVTWQDVARCFSRRRGRRTFAISSAPP
jgi:hypothetical protein